MTGPMPAPVATGADLVDQDELATLLGVAPSTLRAMRADPGRHRRADGMPAPLRTVGGSPVWDRGQIEWWLASK